jgi:hypothetical protein
MCPGLHLVFFYSLGAVNSVLSKYTCRVKLFENNFIKKYCSMIESWFHVLGNKVIGSIKFYFIFISYLDIYIIPNSFFMCFGRKKSSIFDNSNNIVHFEGLYLLKLLKLYEFIFLKN